MRKHYDSPASKVWIDHNLLNSSALSVNKVISNFCLVSLIIKWIKDKLWFYIHSCPKMLAMNKKRKPFDKFEMDSSSNEKFVSLTKDIGDLKIYLERQAAYIKNGRGYLFFCLAVWPRWKTIIGSNTRWSFFWTQIRLWSSISIITLLSAS